MGAWREASETKQTPKKREMNSSMVHSDDGDAESDMEKGQQQ